MKKEKSAETMSAANPSLSNSPGSPAGFQYEGLLLSIEEMLKSGVHFGHKTSRWHPSMRPYIFGSRNGIHIIDLNQSLILFQGALDFIGSTVKNGGKILFAGTKPQAQEVIRWTALETGMPFVSNRWLGGTFTNFNEIKKRIKYLNEQERKLEAGEFSRYTKYEIGKIKKEIEKMEEKMGGLKQMESLPNAVFVADIKQDELAVKEARKMKIPVIAIIDSNNNPGEVDFCVPGNNDALSSLKYILGLIVKTIKESKPQKKQETSEGVGADERIKRQKA